MTIQGAMLMLLLSCCIGCCVAKIAVAIDKHTSGKENE